MATAHSQARRRELEKLIDGKVSIGWAEKRAKEHHSAIDREDVLRRYHGLVEKFRVDGREELSDALKERVDKLDGMYGDFVTMQVAFLLLEVPSNPCQVPEFYHEELARRELTWEDILANDPLEGEHWQDPVFESESELEEGLEEELEEEDSGTEDDREVTFEPLPKPIDSYTLRVKSEAEPPSEYFWLVDAPISEANVIRECIIAMLGQPGEIFEARTVQGFSQVEPRRHSYTMAHLTPMALNGVLTRVGEMATTLAQLRQYTDKFYLTEVEFHYRHVFGIVAEFVEEIEAEILSVESHNLFNAKVVSIMAVVDKLGAVVEPYQTLVEVLKSVSTQVELLNELYHGLQLTSNRILERVFMVVLADYKLAEFINHGTCGDGAQFFVSQNTHVDATHYWSNALEYDASKAPWFLQPYTETIFITGKASGFLHALNAPLVAEFVLPEYTDLDTFMTQLDASINLAHQTTTHQLSNYLFSECRLKQVLGFHFDTYFMLDQTGRMADFLSRMHATRKLDRFVLEQHLTEVYKTAGITASLDDNNVINLTIRLNPRALINVAPPRVAQMYRSVWAHLARLSRTHADYVTANRRIEAAKLHQLQTKLHLYMLARVRQFWAAEKTDNVNIIDAHELLVRDVHDYINNTII